MSRLARIIHIPKAFVQPLPPSVDPVTCDCQTQAEHGMCEHKYPPQTKLSVLSAYADNCVKRHELGIPLLPRPKLSKLSDAERLDNYEAIRRLAQRVGSYRLLLTIVRNVARQDGEIVDFEEGQEA